MVRRLLVLLAALCLASPAWAQFPGVGTTVDQTRAPVYGPNGLKAVVYRQAGELRKVEIYPNATDKPDESDAAVAGTAAWAAAQFAASPAVHLVCGTFLFEDPWIVSDTSGLLIEGLGDCTVLQWAGSNDPETDPALVELRSVRRPVFRNLKFKAPPGVPIQTFILSAKVRGLTLAPRYLTTENVSMEGNTNEMGRGVRLIGGVCLHGDNADKACTNDASGDTFCSPGGGVCTVDSDNDRSNLTLTCANNRGPCFSCEHSQCLTHYFVGQSIPNAAGALCGLAAGGGACTAGTAIGDFCVADADCPSGGAGSCSRSATAGGAFQFGSIFMGAHQLGDICSVGQVSAETIGGGPARSEGGVAVWRGSMSPLGGQQNAEFDSYTWTGNNADPARTCRNGTNNGTACSVDSTCTGGGYCGGCTASRRGVISAARCEGGSNPGVVCPTGTECTGGGTCTPTTVNRPCCSGAGAGSECLHTFFHQAGGSVSVTNSQIATAYTAAFDVALNAASSKLATATIKETTFFSTASSICLRVHPATERCALENVKTSADGGTNFSFLQNRGDGTIFSTAPVTPITQGQTLFLSLNGGDISGTVQDVQQRLEATTLGRTRANVSAAPGTSESVVLTLQIGTCGSVPSDTAVTTTISGSAVTGDDLTNAVVVTAGQCGNWKVTYSAGAATSRPRAQIQSF